MVEANLALLLLSPASITVAEWAKDLGKLFNLVRREVSESKMASYEEGEKRETWMPYKLSAAFKYMAPAFQIIDGIYYVGSRRESSYLVTSPDGHMLVDTGFPETGPLILKGILDLGFNPKEIKCIVITHAHVGCLGGAKLLARETGARICIGEDDVKAAEEGSPGKLGLIRTPNSSQLYRVEFLKVDKPLKEGDIITIGEKEVTVYHTPGHTSGCCSLGLKISYDSQEYNVFLFGGLSQEVFEERSGFGFPSYHGNIQEYVKTLDRLATFPVDIWLTSNPKDNKTFEKLSLLKKKVTPNPYIDPDGWKAYLESLKDGLGRFL